MIIRRQHSKQEKERRKAKDIKATAYLESIKKGNSLRYETTRKGRVL